LDEFQSGHRVVFVPGGLDRVGVQFVQASLDGFVKVDGIGHGGHAV
jgi:hypothetical protein